jgi:hypothetical protein
VTAAAGRSGDLIIVSAADSGYFPLLRDAVMSVRALDAEVAVGVLDLGLFPHEREWLAGAAVEIVRPGWDVAFPGQGRTPETFKAQVSRPFLPRHFPGHAMYFWLDADAWIQDWRIVDLYCAAAGSDKLAIAVEIDRAYKRHYKRPKLFGLTLAWKCYREAFGWRVADRLGRNPFANCGVFALHRDAPHWAAWARIMTRVLQRTRFFYAEQIASPSGCRRISCRPIAIGRSATRRRRSTRRAACLSSLTRRMRSSACSISPDRTRRTRFSASIASMAERSRPRCATARAASCAAET